MAGADGEGNLALGQSALDVVLRRGILGSALAMSKLHTQNYGGSPAVAVESSHGNPTQSVGRVLWTVDTGDDSDKW